MTLNTDSGSQDLCTYAYLVQQFINAIKSYWYSYIDMERELHLKVG